MEALPRKPQGGGARARPSSAANSPSPTACPAWPTTSPIRASLRPATALLGNGSATPEASRRRSASSAELGRQFPITGGVPRLADDESDPRVLKPRDSFAWEWKRYPGSLKEDERELGRARPPIPHHRRRAPPGRRRVRSARP